MNLLDLKIAFEKRILDAFGGFSDTWYDKRLEFFTCDFDWLSNNENFCFVTWGKYFFPSSHDALIADICSLSSIRSIFAFLMHKLSARRWFLLHPDVYSHLSSAHCTYPLNRWRLSLCQTSHHLKSKRTKNRNKLIINSFSIEIFHRISVICIWTPTKIGIGWRNTGLLGSRHKKRS